MLCFVPAVLCCAALVRSAPTKSGLANVALLHTVEDLAALIPAAEHEPGILGVTFSAIPSIAPEHAASTEGPATWVVQHRVLFSSPFLLRMNQCDVTNVIGAHSCAIGHTHVYYPLKTTGRSRTAFSRELNS